MQRTTFRIRRKIILAFLFSVLAVLVFATLSFQVHREIGRRLRLVEWADDLVNNILEIRRFEKNLFIYQQASSLSEARYYLERVESSYTSHQQETEQETFKLKKGVKPPVFLATLAKYRDTLTRIEPLLLRPNHGERNLSASPEGESLRNLGQELLTMAERWAKEERQAIDRLFLRAMYLFFISILVFVFLGFLVAGYISRILVRPLFQMQQYMDKIAHGDFTPIPESEGTSAEFNSLFRAFNRMIQELEHHQEQVIQSGKIAAIGTLTSGIAHELNNPINNIVLTAEALKEDFAQVDPEEALGMIQDILVQSERASRIVKNLLDFARSEQPEFELLPIATVIKDTLKLVQNQMVLSGVEAHWDIPPDTPLIKGDPKSLQQVFLNLFINAIQAMKDGGILTVRVYPAGNGQPQLKVEVSDTGEGIRAEDLPHIFEPFFTTKQVGRGTGLGLSVSYGIVQKHGGNIEVKSRPGKGTTFTLSLPVAEAAEKAA
jgi:two-component system NtrC family sensor kinase